MEQEEWNSFLKDMKPDEFRSFMDGVMRSYFRRSLPPVLQGMSEVYGGYYGDKLSRDCPEVVWQSLRDMGIRHFIDLRYKYNSEVFRSKCEAHGISYFSYPVHNDPETIANLVVKFSDFSDLLAGGHFYLQGRSSAYVALAIYWIFENDHGLTPLELRERVVRSAQVKKRALPILHAMVRYKVEHLDGMFDKDEYAKELHKYVDDFWGSPYPQKVRLSVFDFIRAFRNGSVAYDIAVDGLGVLGYMYPDSNSYGAWSYDIVMRPSVSGKGRSFAEAQLAVARHLCRIIPQSIKYPALPPSIKMALQLLRTSLE